MANTSNLQILRSYANTRPTKLLDGQLAYSFASNTLFIGNTTNGVVTLVSPALQTYASAAFATANLAFQSANAQSLTAYVQSAYAQSNLAYTFAQNAYDAANNTVNNTTYLTNLATLQNTNTLSVNSFAQAAFSTANGA